MVHSYIDATIEKAPLICGFHGNNIGESMKKHAEYRKQKQRSAYV